MHVQCQLDSLTLFTMGPMSKQHVREMVSKVREKNPLLAKAEIVRLLAPLEIGRSTIYNILKTMMPEEVPSMVEEANPDGSGF